MQITFIPKSTTGQNKDVIFHSKYGSVYSKSYLKGGANTVRDAGDYNEVSDLPTIRSYFDPSLGFYGLGGTINGVDKKKGENSFVNYVLSFTDRGEEFAANTLYLRWVINQLGLTNEGRIEPLDSDWTKGAAYDIIINEVTPEEFNYPLTQLKLN